MKDSLFVIQGIIEQTSKGEMTYLTEDYLVRIFGEKVAREALDYLLEEGFIKVFAPSRRGMTMYEKADISAHQLLRWEAKKESLKK